MHAPFHDRPVQLSTGEKVSEISTKISVQKKRKNVKLFSQKKTGEKLNVPMIVYKVHNKTKVTGLLESK